MKNLNWWSSLTIIWKETKKIILILKDNLQAVNKLISALQNIVISKYYTDELKVMIYTSEYFPITSDIVFGFTNEQLSI